MLGVAQVVLVLVALVAVAGFITVAQRRLRQLGMLGAIGATERHLRLVVVANGAVVGVVAAVLGAVMGLVAWIAVAPRMENRGRVPDRSVQRPLVVDRHGDGAGRRDRDRRRVVASPNRRPRPDHRVRCPDGPQTPHPAHHSAALAGLLIVAGTGLLVVE